jgi:hypothetical protein
MCDEVLAHRPLPQPITAVPRLSNGGCVGRVTPPGGRASALPGGLYRASNTCDCAPDIPLAGSEKAAAHHLDRSYSTVKHRLANARCKVGAATTAQLVWILSSRLPESDGVAERDDQAAVREQQRGLRRKPPKHT